MSDETIQTLYDNLFKSVEARTPKMGVREKLGYYYEYFTYLAGWMASDEEQRYKNVLSRYKRFNEQRSGQSSDRAGSGAGSAGLNGQMSNLP